MNPRLDLLRPYPFERLAALLKGITPKPGLTPINWAVGEPQHEPPALALEVLEDESRLNRGLGAYPPTKGLPELRAAIADFLTRRYGLPEPPDPETQILPVQGTREALFAFGQTVLDTGGLTLMPNPCYQIYEGAALLAGSQPWYLDCLPDNSLRPALDAVPDKIWRDCQLIYICSPGNPTGAVMPLEDLQQLIALSDQHGFVIAADECYSEVYLDEAQPPPGLLQAAAAMGRLDYRNCIAFNSLSKRSSLPGLRSGYAAGDAALIAAFLKYRTYHGAAMPVHHQLASIAAWQDEAHVVASRAAYREKLRKVAEALSDFWPVDLPDASFFLWPQTPISDTDFAARAVAEASLRVLPGSFLSRDGEAGNPGAGRVRLALVASIEECLEAVERLRTCWPRLAGG